MELEFDKEIDTILRKAGSSSAHGEVKGPHLDADAVAAFAEGALPLNVRMRYTEHMADCSRCTGILANAIRSAPDEEASLIAPEIKVAEVAVPWYKALFATRNLALAMGSLALLLAVMIGYMAFRNMAPNATVSQVKTGGESAQQPFPSAADAVTSAANSTANTAPFAPAANMAVQPANPAATAMPQSNTAAAAEAATQDLLLAKKAEELPIQGRNVSGLSLDGATAAKPAAAPPPPPVTRGRDTADSTASVITVPPEAEKDRQVMSEQKAAGGTMQPVINPPPSAKMSARRSGPLQNQSNQVNNRPFDLPVTRTAGGKNFNNRDSVWYDSSYSGQATTNVRRGTDEFKKLDSGLRDIANTIGGTVVVVWKSKAYRIQ